MTTETDCNAAPAPPSPYEEGAVSGDCWRHAIAALAVFFLWLVFHFSQQNLIFEHPSENLFLRVAGLLLFGSLSLAVCRWMRDLHKDGFKTHWWNVGDVEAEPSWEDVRKMTVGELQFDPVVFAERDRELGIGLRSLYLLIGYMIVGSIALFGLSVIASDRVLPLFLTEYKDQVPIKDDAAMVLNLSGNLTAFLALIAAGISIYFTHRQLQAKVKADSRQAWIDKLRSRIATAIALADQMRYDASALRKPELARNLIEVRLEMELMLNPKEKDHRLLMYLVQKLAFFEETEHVDNGAGFEKIDDVINIKKSIRQSSNYDETLWSDLLSEIPNKFTTCKTERSKTYSNLIGYAMRLSHVVLKREWERVKATR